MKKIFSMALICLLLSLTACTNTNTGKSTADTQQYANAHHEEGHHFINSMGCEDTNCTDSAHYHDCDEGCTDPAHYHNCNADCDIAEHHHGGSHHEEGHHQ